MERGVERKRAPVGRCVVGEVGLGEPHGSDATWRLVAIAGKQDGGAQGKVGRAKVSNFLWRTRRPFGH
jgi:hypothetical protein